MLGADGGLLLGDDLIVWILLALGGALFVGNLLAVIRPPAQRRDTDDLAAAPRARTLTMAAIGFVVFAVALISLMSK